MSRVGMARLGLFKILSFLLVSNDNVTGNYTRNFQIIFRRTYSTNNSEKIFASHCITNIVQPCVGMQHFVLFILQQ